MIYSEIIDRLFAMTHGMNLGLENVEQLQRILEFPDRTFRSIHVAGTNGKGSVCIKIALSTQHQRLIESVHGGIVCHRNRLCGSGGRLENYS